MEKTKIILDCDPGNDDAINILLALSSEKLDILGITSVFGNVDVEKTTRNANIVCSLVDKQVPIYKGASEPLVLPRIDAASVHGKSGLAGTNLPEPKFPVGEKHAVQFIIDTVLQNPHEVVLVPTGALTNIALAMKIAPEIVPLIKEIVLMGGSTSFGNRTPAAEFNMLADPHSAAVVFASQAPVTMFGLNATHQVLATQEIIADFLALNTRTGKFVAEILENYRAFYARNYNLPGGALHDPLTVGYLLAPNLFTFQNMYVEVETDAGHNMGRTTCDIWGNLKDRKQTKVAVEVDAKGFFALLLQQLKQFA